MTRIVAIVLLALSSLGCAAGPRPPVLECQVDAQIEDAVRNLGTDRFDYKRSFALFEATPAIAACHLIRNLRVVPVTTSGPQEKFLGTPEANVVWSLRALSYITNGLSFAAYDAESARRLVLDAPRQGVLGARYNYKKFSFFGEITSSARVYFATEAIQREVVRLWIDWYTVHGANYAYRAADSYDDWYF